MKKRTLTEGVVDKIYKLLSMGKYNQAKNKFRGNKDVTKAINNAEKARTELVKALEKARKSHGFK